MNMDNIEIGIADKTFTFSVKIEVDPGAGAPWENSCGHGPVSEWVTRDKLPGELVLSEGRGHKIYYDFAKACEIALRDGWDHMASKPDHAETPRQRAARAARADYEYLRAWCNNEWGYVGIIVTLLDEEGNETDVSDSLWGVEDSDKDYVREMARGMADELAGGYGVSWGEVTKTTYERWRV